MKTREGYKEFFSSQALRKAHRAALREGLGRSVYIGVIYTAAGTSRPGVLKRAAISKEEMRIQIGSLPLRIMRCSTST